MIMGTKEQLLIRLNSPPEKLSFADLKSNTNEIYIVFPDSFSFLF
jgi:hypothetical protein